MIRAIAIFIVGTLVASCATQKRTYNPPDPSKVLAAQHHYNQTVGEAHDLAKQARDEVASAHESAMKVTLTAGNAIENLTTLRKTVPETYQPAVDTVTKDVQTLLDQQHMLITDLDTAQKTQGALEQKFVQADTDKNTVQKEATTYFQNAQHLADDATRENGARVKAEQKLSWYRWHWWGAWIALGTGVLAIIVVGFLKFTGRLAMKMP